MMNEYKLIIDLSESLRNKVYKLKAAIGTKLNLDYVSRPYVLLASFRQHAQLEEKLVNRLSMVSRAAAPFKLGLSGFGAVQDYSVYINVSSTAVGSLVSRIKTGMYPFAKYSEKQFFNSDPSVNIAQRLGRWQFEMAVAALKTRQFTGQCLAKEMLLLKRRVGDKNWMVVRHLGFENLPIEIKQTQLF